MLTLHLEAHTEPLAAPSDLGDTLNLFTARTGRALLWHQAQTFHALSRSSVAYNTSATGTGKTLAAQLHLLRDPSPTVTVVIAPTNALIDQHVDDWKTFCAHNGLPHYVIGLDAARLQDIHIHSSGPDANNAHKLAEVLSNPQQHLHKLDKDFPSTRPPLVLVTNPDLFYWSVFFQYARGAQQAALAFLQGVHYLVIDELHYYSGLQLVAFFFVMGFWNITGVLRKGGKLCLLTATPDAEVQKLMDGLRQQGVTIEGVHPEAAPTDRERVVSLAPCTLHLLPLSDANANDQAQAIDKTLRDWVPQLDAGEDFAVLLDSLNRVSRLYGVCEGWLGDRVRRITGPTPRSQRVQAQSAQVILATPTVDLGYNFLGRDPNKQRQSLDRVIFEAPSGARFWQRLGRAGRVLRVPIKDSPTTALAHIPRRVLNALTPLDQQTLSRQALQAALNDLGDAFNEWRVTPLLEDWAAVALSKPLSEIYALASDLNKPRVEEIFKQLMSLFGQTDYTFKRFIAHHRTYKEAKAFIDKPEISSRSHLGWMREADGSFTPKEKRLQIANRLKSVAPHKIRPFINLLLKQACAHVACYQAAMAFRGGGQTGEQVWAWDAIGLFADWPDWVSLSLDGLVRTARFEVIEQAQISGRMLKRQRRHGIRSGELKVRLTDRTQRRLELVRALSSSETLDQFQGRLMADDGFLLQARASQIGTPVEALPGQVLDRMRGCWLAFFIPKDMRDVSLHPQARVLFPATRFVFIGADGVSVPVEGFLGQHAVIAHGLRRERWKAYLAKVEALEANSQEVSDGQADKG